MADDQDKSQQTEEPTAKRLRTGARSTATSSNPPKSDRLHPSGRRHPGHRHVRPVRPRWASPSCCAVFLEQPDQMSVDGAGSDAGHVRGVLPHAGPDPGALLRRDDRGGARRPCAAEPPRLHPRQAQAGFLQAVASWPASSACSAWKAGSTSLKGLLKIAIVGVAIWTQLWPERGMLEAIHGPVADGRGRRHEPSSVQGADGGAGGAGGDRGAGLFRAAHALHAAQPHVQAGDQGRISPE